MGDSSYTLYAPPWIIGSMTHEVTIIICGSSPQKHKDIP
jgi:hypothetical protein